MNPNHADGKTMKRASIRRAFQAALVISLAAPLVAAGPSKLRIIQTNSAGDRVSIIDPATNKVVGEILDIEVNHGAAVSPDGSRIYVSNEADSTLDVADATTFKVFKKIPLSGHPNNISIAKDGSKVYVAIAVQPGAVDVIDTATLTKSNSIPVKGAVHNTYTTPDGRWVVAGTIAGKNVTVIDPRTEQPAWTLDFDLGVRPLAFSQNPDGSTKWMFVQLSGLNGFAVVDWATHKEIQRIKNPDLPPGKSPTLEGGNESHGMAVTADQKFMVVNSRLNSMLYKYSLPELKVVGSAEVGMAPDWVTLTPDGKTAYVANAGSHFVSVIDVGSMKEITRIKVGFGPKRNVTAMLQ
jgi:YVTN family beta-propeller protein